MTTNGWVRSDKQIDTWTHPDTVAKVVVDGPSPWIARVTLGWRMMVTGYGMSHDRDEAITAAKQDAINQLQAALQECGDAINVLGRL